MIKYFKELIAHWKERKLIDGMAYRERVEHYYCKEYAKLPTKCPDVFYVTLKDGDL